MTAKKQYPFLTNLPAAPLMAMFRPEQTDVEISSILGTNRHRLRYMRQPNATIRWIDADRYAIRLGLHPIFIWGFLWTYELRPVEQHDTEPVA